MTNLEDKLREILSEASTIGAGMDDFGALPKNEQEEQIEGAIAQILQAISDAGYIQSLKAGGKTIVLNGKNPLGYVVYYPDEVMTGREWADELNKLNPPVTTIEGDSYYMFEVSKFDDFLAAGHN